MNVCKLSSFKYACYSQFIYLFQQLKNVLGYNTARLSSSKVPSAFDQYLNKLLPGNGQDNSAYVLNLANEVLLSDTFDVNQDYIEEVQNSFHADAQVVDFAGDSGQIVKDVNNWVKEQTNGKIDKFLTNLSPSSLLLILNAVYFKGTWQIQFDPKLTLNGDFYNHGEDDEVK
nr:intracellular coagulation inhibitor 3-like [Parasteatoda tepidariorum]